MNIDGDLQNESRWKKAILDEGPRRCQLPGAVLYLFYEKNPFLLDGVGHD